MIPASDITFVIKSTSFNKPVCWLCREIVLDDTYAELDITNHIYPYRAHVRCLYQLLGVFCLFAYALPKEGEQLVRAA